MSERSRDPEYPFVEGVINAIADWVTEHRQATGRSDLGAGNPDEVRRLAKDLNLSETDLIGLAGKGRDAAKQLAGLLVALKVDPALLAEQDPLMMRDLQRLCSVCNEKRQCSAELEKGTIAEHYDEFCPNTWSLKLMLASRDAEPVV